MEREELAEALASAVERHAGRETTRRRMFGGVSILLDGRIVAVARTGGELLLRVDPVERDAVLARDGAGPALMGEGRVMGASWIAVDAAAVDRDGIDAWLEPALRFLAAGASDDAASGSR